MFTKFIIFDRILVLSDLHLGFCKISKFLAEITANFRTDEQDSSQNIDESYNKYRVRKNVILKKC